MSIKELRAQAKALGIKDTFGKSKVHLKRAIDEATGGVKKGKKTWAPARMLDVKNKNPNFTYRWVDKGRTEQRLSEGWEYVTRMTDPALFHEHPGGVKDGKPVDTALTFRDMILMRLDAESAEARREYVREETRKQTAALKRQAKQAMKQAAAEEGSRHVAPVHGNITIIE